MKNHEPTEPTGTDEHGESQAEPSRAREESELDRLERERDEYLASWKRAAADYQNLRRRLQGDIDAAIARQKKELLGDLLLVLDYLDMALATPVTTEEGRSLHAGVEATRTALLSVLEREGVRPLPDEGRFDPALHACVARAEARGREPGEILAILRRGYTLEGRILRPAQVRVAGEPETEPADEEAELPDPGTD
jgi:molecular chaperone GrpE